MCYGIGKDEIILKEEEDLVNEPQIDTSEPEIEILDLHYLETVETGDEASVYPEVDAYFQSPGVKYENTDCIKISEVSETIESCDFL